MDRYLADFEAARLQSPDAQALVAAMSKKYPDLAIPRFLHRPRMRRFCDQINQHNAFFGFFPNGG